MNKQELIERIDKLPYFEGPIADTVTANREWILKSIQQLEEPQKPVVPQFVADWIEKCKSIKRFITSLAYALNSEVWSENSLSDECIDWLYKAGNQDIFARAWLYGYTVEKEKRYAVKIKGNIYENNLVYGYGVKRYFFSSSLIGNRRAEHTRKELEEAGFEWVFDCSGIEIEEVE